MHSQVYQINIKRVGMIPKNLTDKIFVFFTKLLQILPWCHPATLLSNQVKNIHRPTFPAPKTLRPKSFTYTQKVTLVFIFWAQLILSV